MDFNHLYRYLCLHSHFQALHGRLPLPLRCTWNAFLPRNLAIASIASVYGLSPDHFRRKFARWVSCYALFKWWLPLSQHPYCLCKFTFFNPLSYVFGALIGGLDCFPLGNEAYPPLPDCPASPRGIRSLIRVGRRVCPLAFSVLYPHGSALDAIPKYISERTSYYGV